MEGKVRRGKINTGKKIEMGDVQKNILFLSLEFHNKHFIKTTNGITYLYQMLRLPSLLRLRTCSVKDVVWQGKERREKKGLKIVEF